MYLLLEIIALLSVFQLGVLTWIAFFLKDAPRELSHVVESGPQSQASLAAAADAMQKLDAHLAKLAVQKPDDIGLRLELSQLKTASEHATKKLAEHIADRKPVEVRHVHVPAHGPNGPVK